MYTCNLCELTCIPRPGVSRKTERKDFMLSKYSEIFCSKFAAAPYFDRRGGNRGNPSHSIKSTAAKFYGVNYFGANNKKQENRQNKWI